MTLEIIFFETLGKLIVFSVLPITLLFAFLLSFIRQDVEKIRTRQTSGGELLDLIFPSKMSFHENLPKYPYFDPRFPEGEILPDMWGAPKDMNHSYSWSTHKIDRVISESNIFSINEMLYDDPISKLEFDKADLIAMLDEATRVSEQGLINENNLEAVKKWVNVSIADLDEEIITLKELKEKLRFFKKKTPLSIFGYQWGGFFLWTKDYIFPAWKMRIEYGNYQLKENEQLIQIFSEKDKLGNIVKVKNIIQKKEMVNYIRPTINMYIPFSKIETGIPTETHPEKGEVKKEKYEGLENLFMQGLLNETIFVTNFQKAIQRSGGNFFEPIKAGSEAIVGEVYSSSNYEQIIQSKDETGVPGSVVDQIRVLNQNSTSNGGNPSYDELFGLRIIKLSITDKGLDPESEGFLIAKQKTAEAKEEQKALLIKAETAKQQKIKTSEGDATAKENIGKVENSLARERAEIGPNPDLRVVAESFGKLQGTLVLDQFSPLLKTLSLNSQKIETDDSSEKDRNAKKAEKDETKKN